MRSIRRPEAGAVAAAITTAIMLVTACAGEDRTTGACTACGTAVVAAVGEPQALLPPLVYETVARDISDRVFERLAELTPGGAPIDTAAYRPALAARWTRVDSLTWRFHLRPGARWHDGRPVTAADVVFSFDAYADSLLDAPARASIAGRVRAEAVDSATVVVRFTGPSPEQLFDAAWHVRVIPKHIWEAVPRAEWASDTAVARLVGSGPYRVSEWNRGASLTLVADTARSADARAGIGRLVWRFTADPDAALNLILSGEADLIENLGAPDRVARVATDSSLALHRYPAAVYGFLGFNLADARGRAHPILGDRSVRRALTMATDRNGMARALYGPEAHAPPGPMSGLLWIGEEGIDVLPYDTAAAARLFDEAGWLRAAGGMRRKGSTPLRVDVLVPTTSPARRQLAVMLQEAWRRIGVDVTVTAVDFPVFQERLGRGRFDSYVGAYLDEPTPRGLGEQWGRAGWDALNHGHYANPRFDSLLAAAGSLADPGSARAAYHAAFDTLAADAPAIFLYTPVQVAAVHRRIGNVTIDPYSWLSTVAAWRIDPAASTARDSMP
jgi:peptide/nickel transport system substrate-binding protein